MNNLNQLFCWKFSCWILAALVIAGCSRVDDRRPGSASGVSVKRTESQQAWDRGAIVSAANPHAVAAAIEMLQKGGDAVDAAIAAHAVLGLVEPQSSGLGGGAFMLIYERDKDELVFLDGRETAPAGATIDMFMRDGKVMERDRAWQSGLAVGVPGVVALYKRAHDDHDLCGT